MLPIVRICPERSWGIHISNVDAPNVHKFVQQLTADTRCYIGNFW
mgnify:FL=1